MEAKTSWVEYIGPHRPDVVVSLDGTPRRVEAETPLEVPAEAAKRLLLQPDNWRETKAPAKGKD